MQPQKSCPSCKSVRLVHFTSSGYPTFYSKDNPYIPPTGQERVAKLFRSFFDYFHRFSPMSAETKAMIAELDRREDLLGGVHGRWIVEDPNQDPSQRKVHGIPPKDEKPEIEEIDTGCLVGGPEWRCKYCGHKWGSTE